jgi:uncharacterized protein (DUF849 family)
LPTTGPGPQADEVLKRIKACLNGGRQPAGHPAVPVTAAQLAVAASGAVAAGAEAVHLHPRDAAGRESLEASDIAAAVRAVRHACPGTPIGVSTGLWIAGGDARTRLTQVGSWAALDEAARPDFASANVGEEGFAELVATLHRAGIAVEAGVWSVDDADRVSAVPLDRVLVEIIGGPASDAVARADAVLARLDAHGVTLERLLHGEEEACWPLVAYAGRLGLPTRIGLEDTLLNPDGSAAVDNADLVRRALRIRATAAL